MLFLCKNWVGGIYMSSLSERLKQLKIKRNLLQKDIAQNNNIILRTYQRYERGEKEPSLSTLIKLADYFNVSIDYLASRTNNQKIDSYIDVMYILFELESEYGLSLNEIDGQLALTFSNSTIIDYIFHWNKQKKLYDKGEISEEEYNYWKANFQEEID